MKNLHYHDFQEFPLRDGIFKEWMKIIHKEVPCSKIKILIEHLASGKTVGPIYFLGDRDGNRYTNSWIAKAFEQLDIANFSKEHRYKYLYYTYPEIRKFYYKEVKCKILNSIDGKNIFYKDEDSFKFLKNLHLR